jgi:hypothetical protein
MNLSYHSYGPLILYPWGYEPLFTDDQPLFAALGDSLAAGNGYVPGCTATGAIYVTNGGSDDWMYGEVAAKNRIYGFTIELNSYEQGGFSPPESLILPTFTGLLELNLRTLEYADNPHRVLGPLAPSMNAITALNPPAYEISWQPYAGYDPNEALSFELVEHRNMRAGVDSCEAPDTLWAGGGFALSTARAAAGLASWYSGSGNGLHNTLAMTNVYPRWYPATLACRLWYDIEANWDYAYLEVSPDQGATWKTVPGNRTTNYDPNGSNRGNGITGSSGGWVYATFDLAEYLGGGSGFLLVHFVYETDGSISNEGLYVDLIEQTVQCDERVVLASGIEDTWFHRWPTELGAFTYQVRGIDAEGQPGLWSNLEERIVDDLTGGGTPIVRSALAQNYPNPFNPATTIAFTVGSDASRGAATARVRLDIFDVSGRHIVSLADRAMAPGPYAIVWDGRGSSGRPAAAGVYVARLKVDEMSRMRKLVLLR